MTIGLGGARSARPCRVRVRRAQPARSPARRRQADGLPRRLWQAVVRRGDDGVLGAPHAPCGCRPHAESVAVADDVGVVVIGRNEGERLVNCLNSVKASASRVIYVDSGSVDGSVEFAARIGAYAVRLDPSLPFTAARARNEGFLALKSLYPDVRFVQFIDGDCILVSGWLEAARAFLTERKDV